MQQTETDERWYVQFDSGEVRLMTLEELDAAFEASEVHENTFVIQVGETKWQTLADVAGLSEEEEEAEEAEVISTSASEAEAETTTLYTPQQAASLHASVQAGAPRQPAAAPYGAPQHYAAPPQQYAAPQPHAQPAMRQQPAAPQQQAQGFTQQRPQTAPVQSARPAVAAAAGGWPPVAAPAAQQSTCPPAALAQSNGGYNLGPQSTIPVATDLDLDFDGRSFKSGRRTGLIAAFAVIPALAGGGYMLTRMDTPAAAAVAAAAPAPPPPKTSPWSGSLGASMPTTPTPTPTPAPEAKTDSGSTGRLSDDMKKALLASDSDRSPKSKGKAAAAPARRASGGGGSAKGGSSVFKSGGNANDPLNSKL
ncbi:MAG TPA: hypothetical protein VG937_25745 [Polyangiaceae bacterium]|nr:hypothetical protein [Polyangiaceae bacterium]